MAKFQWLNDESQLQQVVYGELEPQLSNLAAQIRLIDDGFALLRFIKSNSNTLRTVDDIAYYLHQTAPAVDKSLRALLKLDLVRRVQVSGVTWFGMTRDPQQRRSVQDLCAWQDRWHKRLTQIDQVVNGKTGLASEAKATIGSELKQLPR